MFQGKKVPAISTILR